MSDVTDVACRCHELVVNTWENVSELNEVIRCRVVPNDRGKDCSGLEAAVRQLQPEDDNGSCLLTAFKGNIHGLGCTYFAFLRQVSITS